MSVNSKPKNWTPLREKLHVIIFEADTPLGKAFDVWLLIFIVLSVLFVMLESVTDFQKEFEGVFFVAEWVFTIIFTIEFLLRSYCVYKPSKYIFSFFGIVDIISILPTYLNLFLPTSGSFIVIRIFRLIRVFRLFKLGNFIKEGSIIIDALKESRGKITVFMTFVLLTVTVLGSVMYLVEGQADSGFTSIPRSIYWAIVTLTTVGYGDIAPKTELGQFLAAIIMIMGYGVLAVPTGIVSAEMVNQSNSASVEKEITTQNCKSCLAEGHDRDAHFCKYCGEEL